MVKLFVLFACCLVEADECYGRVTPSQPLAGCTLQCTNGGTLDEVACACNCPPEFMDIECRQLICALKCLNGGTLDEADCVCFCPPGYTGNECEEGKCICSRLLFSTDLILA